MTAADSTSNETPTINATPYDLVGGEPVVRRLADRFYEIMDSDPGASHIRAMHERDLAPIRQLLFEFLSGCLGGPPLYSVGPSTAASCRHIVPMRSVTPSATNG